MSRHDIKRKQLREVKPATAKSYFMIADAVAAIMQLNEVSIHNAIKIYSDGKKSNERTAYRAIDYANQKWKSELMSNHSLGDEESSNILILSFGKNRWLEIRSKLSPPFELPFPIEKLK